MNFSHKFFLTLLCFLFISYSSNSQNSILLDQDLSATNIDKVSDEEIASYYKKAQENGISVSAMYRVLTEKGLPQTEQDKLNTRITKLLTGTNKFSAKESIINSGKTDRYNSPLITSNTVQTAQGDLTIFGSELFTTNSLAFEPNLRIPTPAGYILGPDDEVVVNVFGFSEQVYNLTVSAEGNIYIPQVGPLYVNGLSIEQASAKIKSKLASTIYRAISSGKTQVQITLGKIRSIRITVIGEAKKPGNLTVSSLTTLFNILYLVGGPTDYGTYRKIELIRGNEIKRKIDLYSFLLKGDQTDDLLLQEGDVIRIPYYETRVILNGNVKRKGKYELLSGDTFEDLLRFSGGFSDDAYKASITVYQLTENERKISNISKEQYSNYKPLSSDSIIVSEILNRFENRLVIRGAVMRPGEYELLNGMTLKELIEKAGGVKEDVYNKRGSINRLNNNNTPVQVSFNVDSIQNNLSNLVLKKNDEITLYSIFDLKNEAIITIDGFVKRPGTYKWAENISLRDILLNAGGLTLPGDIANIEIAREVKNKNTSDINVAQAEIISVDLSDTTIINDVFLNPYDIVHIRQKPGYTTMRSVFLNGEVAMPGQYTLENSGEKISDIIRRAGGFRPSADSSAIIIKRFINKNQAASREKIFTRLLKSQDDSTSANDALKDEISKVYENISIDLDKALKNLNAPENMVLEDGDIISVERNTNLVKVSGEVYYPTIIPFKENKSLKYYLQKSGSYTPLARKKGTLVVYPDGKAKKVKSFLFFKSYPEIVSRAEIFVPQKTRDNRSKWSVGEWSVVVSSLAIIANVIVNLRK